MSLEEEVHFSPWEYREELIRLEKEQSVLKYNLDFRLKNIYQDKNFTYMWQDFFLRYLDKNKETLNKKQYQIYKNMYQRIVEVINL